MASAPEQRTEHGVAAEPATITRLRKVGLVEGVSYLLLLGVAMPLKYLAGRPEAVKVVGWAHGVLFVWLCWCLLVVMREFGWSLRRGAVVFVAALLPFGPFAIDGWLRERGMEEGRCGSA